MPQGNLLGVEHGLRSQRAKSLPLLRFPREGESAMKNLSRLLLVASLGLASAVLTNAQDDRRGRRERGSDNQQQSENQSQNQPQRNNQDGQRRQAEEQRRNNERQAQDQQR